MIPSTELTLFIITTFLGCIFSLLCLPWRTSNTNISSVLLSSWLLVGCFVLFVNSLVMNTKIWCDISTKLMVGTYVGVPASMICVLHDLYMTISTPNSLPDKRLHQLLCKLALMLCMPALIIIVHIIVQDRRYIFVQEAGCLPSISLSLFPLIAILIWPLLFNIASLAYLGLVIYSIWVPRRAGTTQTPPETITLCYFLRIYVSLFIGVVCTSSISLFVLIWIFSRSNISVDSLHHDFQTVYILTTDQWSHNPQLHTAIELRWLWLSSSIALTIGLFSNERTNRLIRWLTSVKVYIRMRAQRRSFSNAVCHGSLPVYISQTSISSYGEAPAIPPLVRQSTLAPTLGSRVSSAEHRQPEALPQASERGTQSSFSQLFDSETIRPNAPPQPEKNPQPCDPSQSSRSSQQTERVRDPAASMVTLGDSTYPQASSLQYLYLHTPLRGGSFA